MVRKYASAFLFLLLLPAAVLAEDHVDIYAGRDHEGEKKYIRWSVDDSIKISIGFSNSSDVSKVLFSCLEKYDALAWSSASLAKVDYDEPGEVYMKVKLQYIFSSTYLLATLTEDGDLTCHGINDDD